MAVTKRSSKKKVSKLRQRLSTFNPRSLKGGMALFALVFALGGMYYLYSSFAAEAIYDDVGQSKLVSDPKRGVDYAGLKLIRQNADHPCAGVFQINSLKADKHSAKCTHGPDPAPEGTDITDEKQVNSRLDNVYKLIDKAEGKKLTVAENTTMSSLTATSATTLPNFACQNGSQKIVPIYAYVGTNNGSVVKPYIQNWSRYIDAEFLSASSNHRRINWYTTDSTCKPTVLTVNLPSSVYSDPNGSNQYDTIVSYLKSKSIGRPTSKYLIYLDHSTPSKVKICGMANFDGDPKPTLDNKNNTSTGYAMIGPGCWFWSETHEIIHALGADNGRSPNSTGRGHCRDENDVLCYDDYGDMSDNITLKGPMSRPCNVTTPVIDCNRNDYFNVNPSSSNYLYTHWNTASSGFLKRL